MDFIGPSARRLPEESDKVGLSVRPSVRQCIFLKLNNKVVRDRAEFFGSFFSPEIGENCSKMGQKCVVVFLSLSKKLVINFFELFYNESLCLLCSRIIFWKNLPPDTLVKMLSANQVAEFLNQPFLQNKFKKWPIFFCMFIQSHRN